MSNVILALPAECWRWYPTYEGIAQVSTRGDVKTVDRWVTDKNGRKRFIKGKTIKPFRDKFGYLQVTLCRDNKPRHFKVHRLVAETWLDNPEGKPQVNHRDENKENCAVENLSFMTAKENNAWGTRTERMTTTKSMPVQAINPSTGEVVLEFPSTREAERKGFNHGDISACCRGKLKTYKGLVWSYKE